MNLLVTGGAGFIGSNFVRYWCENFPKDKINVLDKLTYAGHMSSLEGLVGIKISFVLGDITDSERVDYVMKETDVVVNFAAESHVDRSIVEPDSFVMTNVFGTYVLLESARKADIKLFHQVSTDEVFGSLPLDRPELKFNENTPYAPHSPYSASKASADHLVRAYHETYGLPVTITNSSNNFGPYQDPEKLVSRFITNLLIGAKVPLMGVGENVRDWIYVKDHVRAIDMVIHRALHDQQVVGETFCVGGNSEMTNRQVTDALLGILGMDESWIEHIPHRLGHDTRYAIDTAKIRDILGWEPEYNFTDGLAKTFRWYQENEAWWKPLKEGRANIDPEVQRSLRVHQEKGI